jgi:hypothetical protein
MRKRLSSIPVKTRRWTPMLRALGRWAILAAWPQQHQRLHLTMPRTTASRWRSDRAGVDDSS